MISITTKLRHLSIVYSALVHKRLCTREISIRLGESYTQSDTDNRQIVLFRQLLNRIPVMLAKSSQMQITPVNLKEQDFSTGQSQQLRLPILLHSILLCGSKLEVLNRRSLGTADRDASCLLYLYPESTHFLWTINVHLSALVLRINEKCNAANLSEQIKLVSTWWFQINQNSFT